MKIENITKPNEKGQIVIPKEIRESLGVGPDTQLHITMRGKGLYIYPIQDIIHIGDGEQSSYESILKKTKGKWASEKWADVRAERRKNELKASQARKEAW